MLDEGEGDVVGDGHGVKEGGKLKEEADLEPNGDQVTLAELIDTLIFDPHFAAGGLQESDDVLEHDGLAATRGTHDDGGLATGDVDVDAIEDDLGAECAGDIDEPDGIAGRWMRGGSTTTGGSGGCASVLGRNGGQCCTLMAMENDARSPVRRVVIHKGRKFDYESLEYVSKSGRTLTKQVVRHPGAVVIVPILPGPGGEPHVALIRSFRASLEKYILELPAGTREVGEDAATTAGREIVEETGYEAATLTEIGRFYTSPGLSDELMVAYAATGLSHVGQRLEEDEDLTVQMTSVEETFALMETGELMDAKSMLALHLARRKGLL